MSRKILPSMLLDIAKLSFLLTLLALLPHGDALACPSMAPFSAYQDIDIGCNPQPAGATYASTSPSAIVDPQIALCPPPPASTTNVNWSLGPSVGCSGTSSNITCGTMTVAAPSGSAPVSSVVTLSGSTPVGNAIFTVTATDANNGAVTCERSYLFHVTSSGGGWGDPHITTVDGVHYDFQSAGEFTALRGDGLEIQTRQIPVATTFLPGANPYTGLSTCVAIYSAVATRVGAHRVSYEPNISGVPDPTGLQLRVDGKLATLGPGGIDLKGGRIVKPPAGDGIEINYLNGTILEVTPAFWTDQQKWYLNVNVSGTAATKGIFGKLAKGSWLPALPSGVSLGRKQATLHQRYLTLYDKFAEAWRVSNSASLFDYAHGTSTATFTHKAWPRENPTSCGIQGQPSAPPGDVAVAQKQCSAITDNNMKADCVFDVSVTANTGFARTYQLTQQTRPDATVTNVTDNKDPSNPGENVTFTATVAQALSRRGTVPAGTVQFILDGANAGKPVTLDSKGRALWSTSSLRVGQHQIVANYIPTGSTWRRPFLASTSPAKTHTVNQVVIQ